MDTDMDPQRPLSCHAAAEGLKRRFAIDAERVTEPLTKRLGRRKQKGVKLTWGDALQFAHEEPLFSWLCNLSRDPRIKEWPARTAAMIERGRQLPGEVWGEEPDGLVGRTEWNETLFLQAAMYQMMREIYRKLLHLEFDEARFRQDFQPYWRQLNNYEADLQIPAYAFTEADEDEIHLERAREEEQLRALHEQISAADYSKPKITK